MTTDYSFAGHTTTLGDHVVQGYSDADGISVSRSTASTSRAVGIDGSVVVSIMSDESADITLSLNRGSLTHRLLYTILANQKRTKRLQPFSFLTRRDSDGEEIIGADVCWIQQEPDQTLGGESGALEWVLGTGKCRQYEPGMEALTAQPVPVV